MRQGVRDAIRSAARLAGLCVVITTAWFVGFLIPEPSRELLVGHHSDPTTRASFIVVVMVASLAARHAFSLSNTWTAVAAWGISAPVGGFLAFLLGAASLHGDLPDGMPDERALRMAAQVVSFYLMQCWYVILALGPATALALSWDVGRGAPGPAPGGSGSTDAVTSGCAGRSGADPLYPM